MNKQDKGIYEKFTVRRTDGKDAPGEKHEGCDYFVLDLTHDPHAYTAIKAYAMSCKEAYPALAVDLLKKAQGMKRNGIFPKPSAAGILRWMTDLSDSNDAKKWRALCEAVDEGKLSLILEKATTLIDGGEIVTDIDSALEHIGYE